MVIYAPLPAPAVLALLDLFIHLNLVLSIPSGRTLQMDNPLLSFGMLYFLSGIALAFLFFLNKPWHWWGTTPLVIYCVQSVVDEIHACFASVARLEKLKYQAPGA
jgi:hypothetical protein